jgi:hypothetical protein
MRYTLFLSGTLQKVASQTITFQYDLRTLIPVSCRGKKFIITSSFDTTNIGGTDHSGLIVSCNLPQTYNKSYSSSYNFVLGVAQPVFCQSNSFKYNYQETEYLGKMIDYPDTDSISVTIVSASATAIAEDAYFFLYLTFEECL